MQRSSRTLLVLGVFFAMALQGATAALSEKATVAVAANASEIMKGLAERFGKETGNEVVIITGSSGKLYAQISEGAPYDAMFSADAAVPERLEAEGKGVKGTRYPYAIGRLVLWSVQPGRVGQDGKATLMSPETRRIAIANPELAPYGLAAQQAMTAMGIFDKVTDRIVKGQNVGQTYALIAQGAADVGFVALSQISGKPAAEAGSHWLVPKDLHAPIRQEAILLTRGADNKAAKDFLAYVADAPGREAFAKAGYESP